MLAAAAAPESHGADDQHRLFLDQPAVRAARLPQFSAAAVLRLRLLELRAGADSGLCRCITRARGQFRRSSSCLAGQFTIYNNETLNDLIFENRYVMLAVSVVFAPVIEETLGARRGLRNHPPGVARACLHRLGAAFYAHAQLAVFWAPLRFCPSCSAVCHIFRRPSRWRGSMKKPAPSGPPSRCTR